MSIGGIVTGSKEVAFHFLWLEHRLSFEENCVLLIEWDWNVEFQAAHTLGDDSKMLSFWKSMRDLVCGVGYRRSFKKLFTEFYYDFNWFQQVTRR